MKRFNFIFVGYHTQSNSIGRADTSRGLTKPLGDVLSLTLDEARQVADNMSGGGIDLISVEDDDLVKEVHGDGGYR